ncbi:transglutaminase-like domain-containing protein [Pseudoalteromonas rubra]|uniref:Transglutaminase-like domain-containing protein n=1 Tax=Pseudoalteromonas rubra TaxID=43658 RepID=A0A0F4QHM5_9GAMM|nr:transglutaminase-like domain-containing protein [Pseudoalteromonas rubra]KJZ06829.1 hypothetical protein TW77_17540 [Pseudoalteromonas rubra]
MTNNSIQLEDIRARRSILALITYSLVLCMLFVFYSPSALAMRHAMGQQDHEVAYTDQLMTQLEVLKDNTEKALYYVNKYADKPAQRAQALTIYRQSLKAMRAQLSTLAALSHKEIHEQLAEAMAEQDQTAMTLNKRILAAYEAHWPVIADNLKRQTLAERANLADAQALERYLSNIQFGRSHHQYDNDQLPFGPLPNVAHRPADSIQALQARLGIAPQSLAMSALQRAESQDLSAYLALNVDTARTAELEQLAASLNSDPVQIYQYVYNHIEYVPAFGSIQGADYTRQTQRGNAFDQASLMISLLRLSGVPARYVYGSVEVDPEQVKNWVGGVAVIEAAQNLLGQGGVPNVIIKGAEDSVVSYGLEHVWVEFYQDGQWHAADPSFKQYEYSEGVDLKAALQLDGRSLTDSLLDGAEQNEIEGWVKHLNRGGLESKLQSAKLQLENALEQSFPGATVQEVLGEKVILQQNGVVLPTLPYHTIRASQALKHIPDNLRHKFKYELQSGASGLPQTHIRLEKSLPEILGYQTALSFTPATRADSEVLRNYLPSDLSDVSQLPKTFPYGLANVKAEISISGNTVVSGGNFAIGDELQASMGFWSPRFGWELSASPLIAGEYHGIGIDAHGVSREIMGDVKNQFIRLKERLESGQTSNISRHEAVGSFLQAGIYTYFASTQAQNVIASVVDEMVTYRQPSYGTFSTNLSVSYRFGVPFRVEPIGFTMDVDQLSNNTESSTNCWDTWHTFNKHIGGISSYLENRIPEILLTKGGNTGQGVSAIAALNIASNLGQKIYTLTQSNLDSLQQVTIDSQARSEILIAVQAGKTVLLHERPVQVGTWHGSGYVIYDQDSGAGAYKISGGANGGFLSDDAAGTLTWLGFVAGAISTVALSFLFYVAAIITVLLLVDLLLDYRAIDHRCAGLGGLIMLAVGVSIAGIFAAPLMGIVLMYTGLLAGNAPLTVANSSICRN